MKILVTGATGFLGRHVVERLCRIKTQHEIIATGRDISKSYELTQLGAKFVSLDLSQDKNFNKLIEITENCDCVIHCAAFSSNWGGYEKFYQANVIATRNIITACLENNIKRLVYISTPSIYTDYTDKFSIQENSILPEVFINNYAKTKKIAEDLIQQAFCKKKLPVITLRPRGLFGPYDQTIMPRIIRAGIEGRVPLINNGEALLDITYIDNVVDAIILAMNADNKYLGNVYNITNGEPVKLIELLTKIFKRLDIRLKTIKLPFLASYYYAYLLEIISKLKFGKPEPRLTRYSVAVLGCSQTLDITAARRDLGYIPRITISEGIDRYVDWFKTHKDC